MAKVTHKFSRKVFAEVQTESWFSIIFSRTGIPLATTVIFIWWLSERIQAFRYLHIGLIFPTQSYIFGFYSLTVKQGKKGTQVNRTNNEKTAWKLNSYVEQRERGTGQQGSSRQVID